MPQPKEVRDHTLDRLKQVKARLQECLEDAADVRVRLTKARNANVWPDLRSASRLVIDYNDRRRSG